jgi:hypothetical protein
MFDRWKKVTKRDWQFPRDHLRYYGYLAYIQQGARRYIIVCITWAWSQFLRFICLLVRCAHVRISRTGVKLNAYSVLSMHHYLSFAASASWAAVQKHVCFIATAVLFVSHVSLSHNIGTNLQRLKID